MLRDLGPSDVTERYLEWLGEPEAQKNITATTASLSALMQYVVERTGRTDVLFLGIFDALNGVHIGNIKYEPVNSALGYAIVGVLIGDVAYRGRGVATEVLRASTAWLKANRQIHQFLLGLRRFPTVCLQGAAAGTITIGATRLSAIRNIARGTLSQRLHPATPSACGTISEINSADAIPCRALAD